MAKIKLVDTGWTMVPEGVHTFKIANTEYDEDFGKVSVEMITAEGLKHTEEYRLITKSGKLNEGAQKAFSYFAKASLNNWGLEEIDPEDLIGCYIQTEVTHEESIDRVTGEPVLSEKTGKPFINVRLNNITSVPGFGSAEEAETEAEIEADELDLDAIDDWLE